MAPVPQVAVHSWSELTSLADKLDVGDGFGSAYVYRGQEDVDWTLKPSLHRAVTNEGRVALPSNDDLLRVERVLTEKFQAIATNHLPAATVAATNGVIDWWPLMRHYGVPTRLLDWTASLYVALYFAVARAPEKDGALYLVHTHTLHQAMRAAHGEAGDLPTSMPASDRVLQRADAPPVLYVFNRKIALLDRMIAQQGLFMVSANVGTDFEEVLGIEIPKAAPPKRETLRKVRIPAAQKSAVMRRLRAMNVTASSLFPGLDGIGRQLDELARHR